jgi:hypothetical protein
MKEVNKYLDFFQEVANRISVRSEQGTPISSEEVFDLFKDTLKVLLRFVLLKYQFLCLS